MGFDPGVFGRFDLAALVQPHLKFLFVCSFVCLGLWHIMECDKKSHVGTTNVVLDDPPVAACSKQRKMPCCLPEGGNLFQSQIGSSKAPPPTCSCMKAR